MRSKENMLSAVHSCFYCKLWDKFFLYEVCTFLVPGHAVCDIDKIWKFSYIQGWDEVVILWAIYVDMCVATFYNLNFVSQSDYIQHKSILNRGSFVARLAHSTTRSQFLDGEWACV